MCLLLITNPIIIYGYFVCVIFSVWLSVWLSNTHIFVVCVSQSLYMDNNECI